MSFVRVRLPNGHEASLGEAFALAEGLEVLDAPATDLRGKPLPATRKHGRPVKPKTTVNEAAAKKAQAGTDWLQQIAASRKSTTGGDAEQEETA